MAESKSLKALLLAYDLADAATARRAAMLRAGGADVILAGFRRTAEPITSMAGCRAIDFGRTYNANFIQRIGAVIGTILRLGQQRDLFAGADVIVARNLEMLAIGVRGRSLCATPPTLVYEILDIHRLLLHRGLIGNILRALEGWLTQRAAAVITSSPAFIDNYFKPLSKVRAPIRLVENKALEVTDAAPLPNRTPRKAGPPWVIGWFGMIRCEKSLHILSELARQSNGRIEIVIRGKPSQDIFGNFTALVAGMPGVRFLGPYKSPEDLAAIYRDVHFSWAIDMFEEGLNSSWLLPNRLYEGGLFGAVPIAQSNVETAHFLQRLGIGVTLADPLAKNLADFFSTLDAAKYAALEDAVHKVPRPTWVDGPEDCKATVAWLQSLTGGPHA
jgi:glycosyltransferase involved in cell wall biosynthesis